MLIHESGSKLPFPTLRLLNIQITLVLGAKSSFSAPIRLGSYALTSLEFSEASNNHVSPQRTEVMNKQTTIAVVRLM